MTTPRILLVEDSLVVRASLKHRLQTQGFDVAEAEDGPTALRLVADTPPDVILLDIELPGMDGYEVLARLKADDGLRDVPVVFLTGRTSSDEMVRALSLGAHDYLRKPFEEAELLARVRAALRVKGLQDELRMRAGELAKAARVDSMTGLYNRRHLDEQLRAACSAAQRHGHGMGVVMLDVDRFKQINDGMGHAAGDSVLQELAKRLQAAVRAEDVVGRWGGEEFLVVLPQTPSEGTRMLAERLLAAISGAPFQVGDSAQLSVTVSVGCTTSPGETPEVVVARADEALYAAKAAGRDRVACLCDGEELRIEPRS